VILFALKKIVSICRSLNILGKIRHYLPSKAIEIFNSTVVVPSPNVVRTTAKLPKILRRGPNINKNKKKLKPAYEI